MTMFPPIDACFTPMTSSCTMLTGYGTSTVPSVGTSASIVMALTPKFCGNPMPAVKPFDIRKSPTVRSTFPIRPFVNCLGQSQNGSAPNIQSGDVIHARSIQLLGDHDASHRQAIVHGHPVVRPGRIVLFHPLAIHIQ